jgi:hypothetical protein
MKPIVAILAVAAVTAMSAPASACEFFRCFNEAVADDAYPPGTPRLDPAIEELVAARQGAGMSLAGFYNDPSLAMRRRVEYHRPVYSPHYETTHYDAPPPPAPEPIPAPGFIEPAPGDGPTVILSPWGRPEHEGRPHYASYHSHHHGPHHYRERY